MKTNDMKANHSMRVVYRKGERASKTKSRTFNERIRQDGIRIIEEAVMICEPEYREEVKRIMLIKYNLI